MTVLLSVFRRPEMLTALLCERRDAYEPEGDGSEQPYSERLVALSAVPESMCAWRDSDIRAWRSLSKVPNMSARAARAIVRSLLSTVVDPDFQSADVTVPDFQGKPIDLRPVLCHPAGEARVLALLGDAIPAADTGSELPSWHWTHRHEIAALPQGFRRHFLYGLSLARWADIEIMLAMFETLSLAENRPLSLAVARMASVGSRDTILWWCDVLAEVPASKRARATEVVLAAGAQSAMPDVASRAALCAADWSAAARHLAAIAGR